MKSFTTTQQIDAPVEAVWKVLNDFGGIQNWNPGVTKSYLTSEGAVAEGSTRHCDFKPFGGVNEIIEAYEPNRRMTISLYETFKLPISSAVADFQIAPKDGGTGLVLEYSYQANLMGRIMSGATDKQMRKGMAMLASTLQQEAERVASA